MNYTFNEETKTYTVGETICTEEEFLENYRICSSCHNAVPIADSIYCESDGEVYCADCANDQYIRQCTWCGRWYSEDDLVCTADTEAYFCMPQTKKTLRRQMRSVKGGMNYGMDQISVLSSRKSMMPMLRTPLWSYQRLRIS